MLRIRAVTFAGKAGRTRCVASAVTAGQSKLTVIRSGMNRVSRRIDVPDAGALLAYVEPLRHEERQVVLRVCHRHTGRVKRQHREEAFPPAVAGGGALRRLLLLLQSFKQLPKRLLRT